jgi:hypothetical protein
MTEGETDGETYGETAEASPASPALSPVLIHLFRGVLHETQDPRLWQQLLQLAGPVRDYVAVLGLDLYLDEAEGYAWLASRESDGEEEPLPRLTSRRPLSFPVSLLLVLLRRKLAEADVEGGDARLILDRGEIVDLMRTFLAESSNEARLVDRIDSYINRVVDLGFARRLSGQKDKVEVLRIIKAFIDAQWLNEFDQRLAAYRQYAQEG